MAYRRLILASAATASMMGAVAAAALVRLPAGTRLPVHWNAAFEPDRYADAATALFLPVVLTVALSLLFLAVPRLEPLQHRLERSAPLLATAWAGLLGLMAVIEAVLAAPAFGIDLPATLPLAATGVLLVAIGNMLPKSRPGFFVGIRTPWTIIDEDNWIATHRLGAWTMMAGGAAIVLGALLPLSAEARATTTIVALAIAVVPPVAYSFIHWQRRASARG